MFRWETQKESTDCQSVDKTLALTVPALRGCRDTGALTSPVWRTWTHSLSTTVQDYSPEVVVNFCFSLCRVLLDEADAWMSAAPVLVLPSSLSINVASAYGKAASSIIPSSISFAFDQVPHDRQNS